MTSIFCFSGSGHSLAIANYFSRVLSVPVHAIRRDTTPHGSTAIVVFPVYCQNIPAPVKAFLKKLNAANVVLIASYGRISYGRVLFEASKLVRGNVIAGAYVPTGHTFLQGNADFDEAALLPVFERIKSPRTVSIPKTPKSLYANIFPGWRSRASVKIIKSYCVNCGICKENCPANDKAGCIRCLRCVSVCPHNALTFTVSPFLKKYLTSHRCDDLVLYL